MANKKVTRRALFTSIMSLILCCAMLMGTTFAWFTDSVTSGNNIIKSGNLDVTMEYSENATNWNDASTGTIFNYSHWEPGYTDVKYIKISNVGSLAFKFQLNIIGTADSADSAKLADVIDVYMIPGIETVDKREQIADDFKVGTLAQLMTDNDGAAYGVMLPAAGKGAADDVVDLKDEDKAIATTGSAEYTLALKMQENAGNEYQNLTVGGNGFTVQLLASQYTYEKDFFDHNYDGNSAAPVVAAGTTPVVANEPTVISVDDKNTGATIATFNLPADVALEEGTEDITVTIVETAVNEEMQMLVNSDQGATSYDITVSGLSEENSKNIVVELFIGKNLSGVELYHNNVKIDYIDYSMTTGVIKFETTSFSPYTIVYDAKAENPVASAPNADFVELGEMSKTVIWGLSGREKEELKLNAAYQFNAKENVAAAQASEYRYWHADFVVKTDKKIAANAVALAGYYSAWCDLSPIDGSWVALTADEEFAANTELRLIESMGSGSITVNYEDICRYGYETSGFQCGIADMSDKLEGVSNKGTTITVELRMYETYSEEECYERFGVKSTNYETGRYITIDTYTYTFE